METIIQKTLRILLDKFGAQYDCVTVVETAGQYRANIETDNAARLIGRNGSILEALQIILKNILWEQNAERVFVSVDVDNYLRDQEQRILEKVQESIRTMQDRNLSEVKLAPMSPYYRRVVHLWISNNHPELMTDSIGEGEERAVKIFHKK